MGKCVNHPNRDTSFICMKHNIYMCEECLKCRDPKIHCKFRPSCPIWFLEKRGGKEIDEVYDQKKAGFKVLFQPEGREAVVPEGATLLEAALAADVRLNASCNGKGVCGKCKLVLESGRLEGTDTPLLSRTEKERNYVLACQQKVFSDMVVRIPEETIERKLKIAGMGQAVTGQLKGLVPEITPMLKNKFRGHLLLQSPRRASNFFP